MKQAFLVLSEVQHSGIFLLGSCTWLRVTSTSLALHFVFIATATP